MKTETVYQDFQCNEAEWTIGWRWELDRIDVDEIKCWNRSATPEEEQEVIDHFFTCIYERDVKPEWDD